MLRSSRPEFDMTGQSYLAAMPVRYEGHFFDFPEEALGGTAEQPRLKPADELLLDWLAEQEEGLPVVGHDRYGVLATVLAGRVTQFFSDDVRHHQRLRHSADRNGVPLPTGMAFVPKPAPAREGKEDHVPWRVLLQVPKYPELFRWYLSRLGQVAPPGTTVAAAFQTRHFSPKLLQVARDYADDVKQTRAHKKARLLLLGELQNWPREDLLATYTYNDRSYFNYPGVFSAGRIDNATRFLLESWKGYHQLAKLPPARRILEIGVGSAIISDQLRWHHFPAAEFYGTDSSNVAILSARRNAPGWSGLVCATDLSPFADGFFDLIVTNPPFHDGHRNAIEPTLRLFGEAARKLSPDGHFVVVANRHLNYRTHLRRLFGKVYVVAANEKFVIYLAPSS